MNKAQFIKHPVSHNLYVIPYIRWRLVFAELVAKAIEEEEFDLVVIDMPYFMNKSGLLNTGTGLFPYVSSLIMKRSDSSFSALPLVPNDAACAAAAIVQTTNEFGGSIELRCIDDSSVINYPEEALNLPGINVRDDYFVFVEGLETYYSFIVEELDRIWKGLSHIQKFFLEHRAGVITERLLELLKQGKQTLFVCEYRLWWVITKILTSGHPIKSSTFFISCNDMKAALVLENPYILWTKGILDDFPAVVLQFYEQFQLGRLESFDKPEAIKKIIKDLTARNMLKKLGNPSIRKIVSFHRYLQNRLSMDFRLIPLPVSQLYDAADSCVGKSFAREMAKRFLRYPLPHTREVLKYLTIHADEIVILKAEAFDIPDFTHCTFFYTGSDNYLHDRFYQEVEMIQRKDVVNRVYPTLDKKELKILNKGHGMTKWAVQKDYLIHEKACRNVRELGERFLCQSGIRIRRSCSEDH
jgi:hypothetical protein